ncbi:Nuclease EXOG, mitochondrial [Varanus komodoensis]|nr:Nuclease EXOG, mitochondrial [Varanus komodoensis]
MAEALRGRFFGGLVYGAALGAAASALAAAALQQPPPHQRPRPREQPAAAEEPVTESVLKKYGFPASGTQIKCYTNHALSYDQAKRIPSWVIEHISKHKTLGNADRKHCKFRPDPSIPPMFSAMNEDYIGSGWSRGHMAPAGDNKYSPKAMAETFYLSNIVPQNYENNAGFWNRIEMYCRELTERFEDVWIVSGPLMLPQIDDDGKKRVVYQDTQQLTKLLVDPPCDVQMEDSVAVAVSFLPMLLQSMKELCNVLAQPQPTSHHSDGPYREEISTACHDVDLSVQWRSGDMRGCGVASLLQEAQPRVEMPLDSEGLFNRKVTVSGKPGEKDWRTSLPGGSTDSGKLKEGSDGVKCVWRQPGEEYKDKCVLPTVKHGGGSVMIWGCMSAAGTGELQFIEGTMNANIYCVILKQNMIPSLRRLGRRAVFQHDKDPKHTSKMTTALLKKLRVKMMDWPSMSPDLNPIEHLCSILKWKVEERKVSNIHQLRDVVMEEWKRIPVATCEALVIGKDDVAVPSHLYKVILARQSEASTDPLALGAFVVPNIPIGFDHQLLEFQVNIEDLEKMAGLIFFPQVDKSKDVRNICEVDTCKLMNFEEFTLYITTRKLQNARTLERLGKIMSELQEKGIKPNEYLLKVYKKKKEELEMQMPTELREGRAG